MMIKWWRLSISKLVKFLTSQEKCEIAFTIFTEKLEHKVSVNFVVIL